MAFLGAAAASMAGAAVSDRGAAPTDEASKGGAGVSAYYVDRLFRSDHPSTDTDPAVRAEAGRIFAHTLVGGDAVATDTNYLSQLVAAKTGLNAGDAGKRVSDSIADARQAEDAARKATAHVLLWIFLALLIGAFLRELRRDDRRPTARSCQIDLGR